MFFVVSFLLVVYGVGLPWYFLIRKSGQERRCSTELTAAEIAMERETYNRNMVVIALWYTNDDTYVDYDGVRRKAVLRQEE